MWGLTLLHPDRVNKVINLSLPYQDRGEQPWIEFMEAVLGGDFYFVHFNRQPGVADAVFEDNTFRFLRNLYRKNEPLREPQPGMALIDLAKAETPLGEPLMSDRELAVFVSAFESTGFTGSVNWYRNLDRNWHLLAEVDPIIQQPTLMIYGDRDAIARAENLTEFVPQCGSSQSRLRSLDPTRKTRRDQPSDLELAAAAGCHIVSRLGAVSVKMSVSFKSSRGLDPDRPSSRFGESVGKQTMHSTRRWAQAKSRQRRRQRATHRLAPDTETTSAVPTRHREIQINARMNPPPFRRTNAPNPSMQSIPLSAQS